MFQQPNNEYPEIADEDTPKPLDEHGIQLGEHIAIVGATGTGKTYFAARGLLGHLKDKYPEAKRYVLDSTDDPTMIKRIPGQAQHVYGDGVPDLLPNADVTQVWTPRKSKVASAYTEWFEKLNDAREPQIVLIDEIASLTGSAEEELEVLLKQLRKHGGTVIACTQQIAKVTTTLFSQMTHYVQFGMGTERYDLSQSRRYLALPKEEQREPLYENGFFYRKTRGNTLSHEYKNMQEFFSKERI